MMYSLTPPVQIQGIIDLPTSKSISNRALLLSSLANNRLPVTRVATCDDTHVMQAALQNATHIIDIGAAGTAMRFLTAYFATQDGTWTLTGSERMKQRPIKLLVEALNSLGADIRYLEKEGFPPLEISGQPLQGGELHLKGNVSSQYISALLMIAPTMQQGMTLTLEGTVISRPYIRMTLYMMEAFGVQAEWKDQRIIVKPQRYRPCAFAVESDWSAASYWYGMAALMPNTELTLEGLQQHSLQGDSKCAELFASLGVTSRFSSEGVVITSTGNTVSFFSYNFVDQPDLAQTVVVTCCLLGVPFRFEGLHSLTIKETDRIAALMNELAKIGYLISNPEDGVLKWNGERTLASTPAVIDTYDDHRMAMAFAIASLRHSVIIAHPEVVSKSYPTFWDDLKQVGFSLQNNK
jgi:3-phosphoshikimate 1-carboxyvinyltransferase